MEFFITKVEGDTIYYQSKKGITVSEGADRLIEKHLVNLFSSFDRKRVWGVSLKYNTPSYSSNWECYTASCVFYVLLLIVAIPLSPATISIFGTTQPAGILIFPLTFPVIDFITEVFGYQKSKRLVYFSAFCCVLAALLIFSTTSYLELPPNYQSVFNPLPYLFFVNAVCLLGADTVNNVIFTKVKVALVGSKLWLRCMISTLVGQVFYTVVWITMFFGADVSEGLLVRVVDNYGFKVAYSLLLIAFTYFLVLCYRKYFLDNY